MNLRITCDFGNGARIYVVHGEAGPTDGWFVVPPFVGDGNQTTRRITLPHGTIELDGGERVFMVDELRTDAEFGLVMHFQIA